MDGAPLRRSMLAAPTSPTQATRHLFVRTVASRPVITFQEHNSGIQSTPWNIIQNSVAVLARTSGTGVLHEAPGQSPVAGGSV